jgi:hypothetical protein
VSTQAPTPYNKPRTTLKPAAGLPSSSQQESLASTHAQSAATEKDQLGYDGTGQGSALTGQQSAGDSAQIASGHGDGQGLLKELEAELLRLRDGLERMLVRVQGPSQSYVAGSNGECIGAAASRGQKEPEERRAGRDSPREEFLGAVRRPSTATVSDKNDGILSRSDQRRISQSIASLHLPSSVAEAASGEPRGTGSFQGELGGSERGISPRHRRPPRLSPRPPSLVAAVAANAAFSAQLPLAERPIWAESQPMSVIEDTVPPLTTLAAEAQQTEEGVRGQTSAGSLAISKRSNWHSEEGAAPAHANATPTPPSAQEQALTNFLGTAESSPVGSLSQEPIGAAAALRESLAAAAGPSKAGRSSSTAPPSEMPRMLPTTPTPYQAPGHSRFSQLQREPEPECVNASNCDLRQLPAQSTAEVAASRRSGDAPALVHTRMFLTRLGELI